MAAQNTEICLNRPRNCRQALPYMGSQSPSLSTQQSTVTHRMRKVVPSAGSHAQDARRGESSSLRICAGTQAVATRGSATSQQTDQQQTGQPKLVAGCQQQGNHREGRPCRRPQCAQEALVGYHSLHACGRHVANIMVWRGGCTSKHGADRRVSPETSGRESRQNGPRGPWQHPPVAHEAPTPTSLAVSVSTPSLAHRPCPPAWL